MGIKKIVKAILLREKRSSDAYINYLRKIGIKIGEGCIIYDPTNIKIDTQIPFMLEIGNYVRMTSGVQILTHDYSLSVLSVICGDIVGSVEKTVLGNNIFIGRNAIILKGVTVGDNVIIGAGSIVSKDCESNCVYAGIPARKICSIEEMYKRRKKEEKDNAKALARAYFEKTGKLPDEFIMREYLMLFSKRDEPIPDGLEKLMEGSGCFDLCRDYFQTSEPEFAGLDEFLKWCNLTQ